MAGAAVSDNVDVRLSAGLGTGELCFTELRWELRLTISVITMMNNYFLNLKYCKSREVSLLIKTISKLVHLCFSSPPDNKVWS